MTDEQSEVDQKIRREFTVSPFDKAKDHFYGRFIASTLAMFERPVTYMRGNFLSKFIPKLLC